MNKSLLSKYGRLSYDCLSYKNTAQTRKCFNQVYIYQNVNQKGRRKHRFYEYINVKKSLVSRVMKLNRKISPQSGISMNSKLDYKSFGSL